MVLMIGEVDPLHCEACELLRQRVRAATTPSFLLSNAFLRPRVLPATGDTQAAPRCASSAGPARCLGRLCRAPAALRRSADLLICWPIC